MVLNLLATTKAKIATGVLAVVLAFAGIQTYRVRDLQQDVKDYKAQVSTLNSAIKAKDASHGKIVKDLDSKHTQEQEGNNVLQKSNEILGKGNGTRIGTDADSILDLLRR